MKREKYKLIATVATMLFAGIFHCRSQSNYGSLGAEFMLPVGNLAEFSTVGVGLYGGVEIQISPTVAGVLTAGINFLSLTTEAKRDYNSGRFIPFQGGFRYYLNGNHSGAYIEALAGIHFISLTDKGYSTSSGTSVTNTVSSEAYFSFAPQVGYFIARNLSLGLRYQFITDEGEYINYAALRLGYNFYGKAAAE